MASSLVGGAALGAAFGELMRAVDYGIINAVQFKSTLTSLRSRLNQISPMLKEINKLNRKLGRLEQDTEMFTNHLKKGLHFVNKCEKIPWWNCFKKWLGLRTIYRDVLSDRGASTDVYGQQEDFGSDEPSG
ncbi:Protein DA1-related 5 [Camellia lanceoleosa]|uniref:Protein DA1-related 5 n=1 Tax=Camellia lanceoleosa TaxID=1840588 RepID=A0ACC0J1D1_9ERIC|nr:Protein DA1-related 5 [Camellia lanceoleosa]